MAQKVQKTIHYQYRLGWVSAYLLIYLELSKKKEKK